MRSLTANISKPIGLTRKLDMIEIVELDYFYKKDVTQLFLYTVFIDFARFFRKRSFHIIHEIGYADDILILSSEKIGETVSEMM